MYKRCTSRSQSSLRIVSGSGNVKLAESVAKKVGVSVTNTKTQKFANNETSVQIKENVRSQDIYIIQTHSRTCNPNDSLMELLLLVSACRLSSSNSITLILPLFPYSQGDRKDGGRIPITCRLVADLLQKAGATQIMIIDPRTPQIEGFFGVPVDSLTMSPVIASWVRSNIPDWTKCVVVSPTELSLHRGDSLSKDLGLDYFMIQCTNVRYKNNTSETPEQSSAEDAETSEDECSTTESERLQSSTQNFEYRLTGNVKGKRVILVDDVINAGDTISRALELLKKKKAAHVYIIVTHGVFIGDAFEKIMSYDDDNDFIKAMVVSNSIQQDNPKSDKFHVMDCSVLISEYIRRNHYGESVSVLGKFLSRGHDGINLPLSQEDRIKEHRIEERDHSKHRPNPKGIRRGFRLSSVCWD